MSPHASIRTLSPVASRGHLVPDHHRQRSALHLSTIHSANCSNTSFDLASPIPNGHLAHLHSHSAPVHAHPYPHGPLPHHQYYPNRRSRQQSLVTLATYRSQKTYPAGPYNEVCTHCGIDPSVLFPTHPWGHHNPWWKHLHQDYESTKPYIEYKRRLKHRRKQQRRRARKNLRRRFSPRTLTKSWKVELKRIGWFLTGWSTYKPRRPKNSQVEKPTEPKFSLRVTGDDEPKLAQHDRDVQGHEAREPRQELLREPEARTDGEPADTSNSRDGVGGLAGKHEDESPRHVTANRLKVHPTDLPIANASAIYGPARNLDVITYGSTSSRTIAAAVVEHNPTGRSYVHCCSAKEDTRLAALEHLLVIQEDIMQRLMDREGITSSGWLPATAQAQHAREFNSMSDLAASNHGIHGPGFHAASNVPSKAPSPTFSSVPSSAPSQPQPHRPGRVQWIMGSEG